MSSSWADVASGKGKGKSPSASSIPNKPKIASATLALPLSGNLVANLTMGLANMTVVGADNSATHTASRNTGSDSNAREHGNRRRGKGQGSQAPVAWPPVPPTSQQAKPVPISWGRSVPQVNDRNSQPQTVRGSIKPLRGKKWTPLPLAPAVEVQNKPTKTLHKFPKLPIELRLKIWGYYLEDEEDRLIEMEHGINDCSINMCSSSHMAQRISRQSRVTPTILFIDKETRNEFMKFYKKVSFDTFTKPGSEIYYNPKKDVIFFGENSCITTLVYVFARAHRQGFDIPRVAIRATNKITTGDSCDWYLDDGDDTYERDLHRSVPGGCNVPQALHGKAYTDTEGRYVITGCPGLKHVFFVQSSMFFPVPAGEINRRVGFRPAVGDGISTGQKEFKASMLEMIDLVQNDIKVQGVSSQLGNKWTGDNKPTFNFVSLAPKIREDGCVYDTLAVKRNEFNKLVYGRPRSLIDKASIKNKVEVAWLELDFPTQREREIGFFGLREGVDKVKKVMKEILARTNAL